MLTDKLEPRDHPWAQKVYEIIFEADTFGGKAFDLVLLVAIVVSVTAVALETVDSIGESYPDALLSTEWICTILFTVEYVVRAACLKNPRSYVFSFFGVIDLLSFLPTYLAMEAGGRSFAVVRALRLLRVFRIMELSWLESEAGSLRKAIWDARAKVVVFFMTVLIIVTIAGTAMYEIEHSPASVEHANDDGISSTSQFESIPQSVYWAIITMTTVGYGDVVPQTTPGKFVASLLVLLGYSLIIVPTGFVSAELSDRRTRVLSTTCPECGKARHQFAAIHCDRCGQRLPT